MRVPVFFALFASLASATAADFAAPENCRQIVRVTAPTWSSTTATVQRWQRAAAGAPWLPEGKAMPALIGERGLAWGAGLHRVPADGAPRKVEGDRRAPAGIFALTGTFGRSPPRGLKMPWQTITPTLEAVDDPASRFYNRIVDRAAIAAADWHSSERMAAIPDYALGVAVAHNPQRQPGVGSCIFLHLWLGERRGTAGCTALRETELRTLVAWLDPARRPVLIQSPRAATPSR